MRNSAGPASGLHLADALVDKAEVADASAAHAVRPVVVGLRAGLHLVIEHGRLGLGQPGVAMAAGVGILHVVGIFGGSTGGELGARGLGGKAGHGGGAGHEHEQSKREQGESSHFLKREDGKCSYQGWKKQKREPKPVWGGI